MTPSEQPQTKTACDKIRESCRSNWRTVILWLAGTIVIVTAASVRFAQATVETNARQDQQIKTLEATSAELRERIDNKLDAIYREVKRP